MSVHMCPSQPCPMCHPGMNIPGGPLNGGVYVRLFGDRAPILCLDEYDGDSWCGGSAYDEHDYATRGYPEQASCKACLRAAVEFGQRAATRLAELGGAR